MLAGYTLMTHMEMRKEQLSNKRLWDPRQRGHGTHLVDSGIPCSWCYGTAKNLHGFRTGVEKFVEE